MGKRVEVLPLSFREYIRAHGVEPKIGEYERIEALFSKYMQTGGFPRSINMDQSFTEDLVISIERDVTKAGRSPRIFRMILRTIMEKAPSAMSYNSIARELGISHNTVEDYVELMEDLFLLDQAYFKEGDKVIYRKEKKFFLRDPYIAKAFSVVLGAKLREGSEYEWIVQEHLYRKFGELYYWRNGLEVDCIAGDLKVEVKAGKPHRRYPRGVRVLGEREIPAFLLEL